MEMNGLVVDYDGEKNVVMYHGTKEYPIGGLAAEYARLHPALLRDIILEYDRIEEKTNDDALSRFFPWFADRLEEKFGPVTAVMVSMGMLDLTADVLKMGEDDKKQFFKKIEPSDAIAEYIFKDTGYSTLGDETNKQLLLSSYYWWAQSYVAFKHSFLMLASEKEYDEDQVNAFWTMFGENIDLQHIDFRIAIYEGKFHSLYTIKSSMSLILFEAAHCIDKNVKFTKCANCGEYFVPEGRVDAIYCGYPSPQDPKRICKDIGAQVTRANKEKNDIATKEYRKVYMKYKMLTIRHPENRDAKKKFEQLMSEVKEWRKKMKNGTSTTEEFLKWLEQF